MPKIRPSSRASVSDMGDRPSRGAAWILSAPLLIDMPMTGDPRTTDWDVLLAACFADSEKLMATVARSLVDRDHRVSLRNLVTTLDDHNLERCLQAIRIARGAAEPS